MKIVMVSHEGHPETFYLTADDAVADAVAAAKMALAQDRCEVWGEEVKITWEPSQRTGGFLESHVGHGDMEYRIDVVEPEETFTRGSRHVE